MLIFGLFFTTVLIVISSLIAMFETWRYSIDGSVKIKFALFKKSYEINPDAWELFCGSVSYDRDDSDIYIDTHFGFVDCYRYKIWHNALKTKKMREKHARDLDIIVTNVNKDIEHTEQAAAQKYKEAEDILTTRN